MDDNNMTRKWKEDKRSWIFYLDEIENNPNIISSEIEGNVFMFDCDTVRLSIWSQKWQAFTDVGASRLINQVEKNHILDKQESATKVFYKGIELQNKYIEIDAGIVEFIDIKGELDRSYINISRKGFTEEGEHFFEEQLYPGILEVIHKILQFLEKEDIIPIFKRILEEKCKNNTDKQELVHFIVSITVLAYYATRTEWDITETLLGKREYRKSNWEALLEEINKQLIEEREKSWIVDKLVETSPFFNIVEAEIVKAGSKKEKMAKHYTYNFLEIFLSKNHWAIIQKRQDAYQEWVTYLIRIKETEEVYKCVTNLPHSENDDMVVKEWERSLSNLAFRYNSVRTSQQQMILNWMLKNMPTVGLFADKTGNTRVNILSNKVYPSIYMNKNFKKLLLRRIMDKAAEDGIQRFSTITWQRREFLGCDKLPYNIFFIKRVVLASN